MAPPGELLQTDSETLPRLLPLSMSRAVPFGAAPAARLPPLVSPAAEHDAGLCGDAVMVLLTFGDAGGDDVSAAGRGGLGLLLLLACCLGGETAGVMVVRCCWCSANVVLVAPAADVTLLVGADGDSRSSLVCLSSPSRRPRRCSGPTLLPPQLF